MSPVWSLPLLLLWWYSPFFSVNDSCDLSTFLFAPRIQIGNWFGWMGWIKGGQRTIQCPKHKSALEVPTCIRYRLVTRLNRAEGAVKRKLRASVENVSRLPKEKLSALAVLTQNYNAEKVRTGKIWPITMSGVIAWRVIAWYPGGICNLNSFVFQPFVGLPRYPVLVFPTPFSRWERATDKSQLSILENSLLIR